MKIIFSYNVFSLKIKLPCKCFTFKFLPLNSLLSILSYNLNESSKLLNPKIILPVDIIFVLLSISNLNVYIPNSIKVEFI